VAEARAQLGIARATKFPQLDGQASYTNQRFSEKSFPLNALGTGSAQQDFYRTGLDLTFELDLWGRLRRATEAGGTILHEHWRIEFRRQYFTSRRAMQRSLDAFMKFYNERRPHQSYRLRGRTPAELFSGVES